MVMHVSDAASGSHMRMHDASKTSRDAGGAFLEAFRVLPESRFHSLSDGLKVAEVRQGHGAPFTNGMKIRVRYTGWLDNGTKFDSSLDHGAAFEFTLGAGRVIKGWEEGLHGMRPGERRQIIIPPSLGYGNRQVGDIPPGSTLVFNVEAVAAEPAQQAGSHNPNGTMTVVA